jgi:exonuclease VII small subunit
VSELGYAAASSELDEIIAELDAGMIDVDVLEARFRRAIEIVEELDRRIRGARERVGALAPRLEAIGTEEAGGAGG